MGEEHQSKCMMKIDIKKVYDTNESGCLDEMFSMVRFSSQIHGVHYDLACVTSPKFSLMVTGALHGYFASKKGH